MKLAFVFPGQGSQAIGMGKALYDTFAEAKEVFGEVDEVLKQKLSDLIFNGNIEELTLTENAQPALMTVSMAVMRVMEKQHKFDIASKVSYVFGHSLGEYSALTAAKMFKLEQAARLLKLRGKSMQEAAPKGTSGMVALLGCDIKQAEEIALSGRAGGKVCQVANDNAEGQIVISGHLEALELAVKKAQEMGKKAVKLPVSAAFHSELMMPAQEVMAKALNAETLGELAVPVIANVTADICKDKNQAKDLLIQQVSGRVRFRESVLKLHKARVTDIVEIGAGKVLSGIIKRIEPEFKVSNVGNPYELEKFLSEFI